MRSLRAWVLVVRLSLQTHSRKPMSWFGLGFGLGKLVKHSHCRGHTPIRYSRTPHEIHSQNATSETVLCSFYLFIVKLMFDECWTHTKKKDYAWFVGTQNILKIFQYPLLFLFHLTLIGIDANRGFPSCHHNTPPGRKGSHLDRSFGNGVTSAEC